MSDEQYQPDKTPGVFAWQEIVSNNKDGTVEFYSNLFGWTTEDMQMPNGDSYTMFMQGQRPIGGCISAPPEAENVPTMWLNYVNTDDLDASVAKAKGLGAKICKERVDLPMGSFAIAVDPQGGTFAFWQPGEDCPE